MKKLRKIEPFKLPSLENVEEVYRLLQQPTLALAEFLTGFLIADQNAYKLSAGRLVQASIKGKLLTQLGREIKKYQEEGKINEDYFATNKAQASLLELLKFIDSEIPDEEVFKAMKSIFFSTVAKNATEKDEQIGHQLLLVCKKLSSMDVLVLKACYEVYFSNEERFKQIHSHGDWTNIISAKVGYELPELVGLSDKKLVEMGLLSPRTLSDSSGVRKGAEFRLTVMGVKLCQFITNFSE